jgi:formylglycine-generating enzyme required for sulfatase activity
MTVSRTIVFISYSHDSDEHREKVLGLSERLRRDGFETRLDQYVNGTPPEGWPRWMLNQLDAANFVLVVCTDTYYRRFRGHEQPDRGKGVDWEGALITQEIYDDRSQTVKFVPVMLSTGQQPFVPEPLRSHTHHLLTSESSYKTLDDFLHGVAGIEPGEIGEASRKSRRQGRPLKFDDADGTLGSPASKNNVVVSNGLPAVVPQGLKSFDEDAKGFFLQLLPGPYHENGLPRSLHFWKRQIEQIDADETFRVGVIYGQSGCGKSSWIKAGLLPRLEGVTAVYVEAIPDGTPQRLLAAVRKRCPWLGDAESIAEALQRKDHIPAQNKVLIVLDQFEQWLHGRTEDNYAELLDALRACDGSRVQCLLLIRSDFWDLLTRFLCKLDVRQEEGKNLAMFDLFDKRHASHVLALFGRAFGAFPKSSELTSAQESFLRTAVDELSDDTGRIVSVRLSLLAEMLKRREWTPATLHHIGGTCGVGFAFLEENFYSKDAPKQYKRHEMAARAVLEHLLPVTGTDIKGAMRSEEELLSRSGYAQRVDKFNELLQILNGELRLITPASSVETNMDTVVSTSNSVKVSDASTKYYQLTHDYLVPSLRDWLGAKKRESWRGRALLLLAERTSEWTSKRKIRALPGPLEYLRILVALLLPTRGFRLETPQRRMLWAATRWFAVTGTALLFIVSAIGWWSWVLNGRTKAEELVAELYNQDNPIEHKKLVKGKLTDYRRWIIPKLKSGLNRLREEDWKELERVIFGRQRAVEAIALLGLGSPSETLAVFDWRTHGDPESQTQFIERAKDRGVTLEELAQLYETATTASHDTARSATLLTLATFSEDSAEWSQRQQIADRIGLSAVFREDPNASLHSAAGCLLRKWKMEIPELKSLAPSDKGPNWFVKQIETNQARDEITFVRVAKGEFDLRDTDNNKLGKRVELTHDFWLSDREVSVGLFRQFVDSVGEAGSEYRKQCQPEEFPKDWNWVGEDKVICPTRLHPVQQVDWNDAVLFCNWLSRMEGRSVCYARSTTGDWTLPPSANGYRLPTEAEWELGCRAGTMTSYSCSSDVGVLKRYAVTEDKVTVECGARMPNPFGLFEMHGNVWEWCQDWYGDYEASERVTDPKGPDVGSLRVNRGGSWNFSAWSCRSALRSRGAPSLRVNILGFRVALSSSGQESSPGAAQPRK